MEFDYRNSIVKPCQTTKGVQSARQREDFVLSKLWGKHNDEFFLQIIEEITELLSRTSTGK